MSKNWEIERGDVFYVYKFGNAVGSEQEAGRPAVIVSNDDNNKHSPTVEIAYLTTKEKAVLPTHTKIKVTPTESTVLCEQITTVAIERLGDFVGTCNTEEMEAIDKALAISIGINKVSLDAPQHLEEPHTEKITDEPKKENFDESVIRLTAERDTFKKLYEDLLSKFIPK